MMDDKDAAELRILENCRQMVLDAQDAVVGKLDEAIEHLEDCAAKLKSGDISTTAFSRAVVQWYELITLLVDRAEYQTSEFSRVACDFDPAAMDEYEPGGYILERRNMIEAAKDLAARTALYANAVADVFTTWMEAAGIPQEGNGA